eukprot:1009683-Amphidinium_carterae.2
MFPRAPCQHLCLSPALCRLSQHPSPALCHSPYPPMRLLLSPPSLTATQTPPPPHLLQPPAKFRAHVLAPHRRPQKQQLAGRCDGTKLPS